MVPPRKAVRWLQGCDTQRDAALAEERRGPSTRHVSSQGPWDAWPPGGRLAQGKAGKMAQRMSFTENRVNMEKCQGGPGMRPALWAGPGGCARTTQASKGAPAVVPPGPAAQAWGWGLQTQELAPSGSAPACPRQELSQHPDRIRVRTVPVPSPGRFLQEGGRSRGRRQRDDPAKCLPSSPGFKGQGLARWGPARLWSLCPRPKTSTRVSSGASSGLGKEVTSGQAVPESPTVCPQLSWRTWPHPGAKLVCPLPCQG